MQSIAETRKAINYISMTDVGSIIDDMTDIFNWLKECVIEFDVTIVGNEYSFLDKIKKVNKLSI